MDTGPLLALGGTLFGGVGLKTVEAILGRSKRRDDTATAIRTELRQELILLRGEMDKLKTEVTRLDGEIDKWRSRYFSLLAAVATNDQDYINKVLRDRTIVE